MSSVIYSLLLVFLLCMHPSNALRLAHSVNKEHENTSNLLKNKNNEKVRSLAKMSVPPSKFEGSHEMSKEVRHAANGDDNNDELPIDSNTNPKDSNAKDRKVVLKGRKQQTNKSAATVSWHVPHKKHGEHQPGFNLDYSPPKTHPPHHN